MCPANFGQLSKPCSRAMTGEMKGREANGVERLLTQPGMMSRDTMERCRLGLSVGVEKILSLLFVLF
jgi:hypothetical protein